MPDSTDGRGAIPPARGDKAGEALGVKRGDRRSNRDRLWRTLHARSETAEQSNDQFASVDLYGIKQGYSATSRGAATWVESQPVFVWRSKSLSGQARCPAKRFMTQGVPFASLTLFPLQFIRAPSHYCGGMASDHGGLRFEMDRLVSYDDASVLDEMRRVVALLPDGPVTRKAFDATARVSSSTVIRRFGGWEAALRRAGAGDRYGGKQVTPKMLDQRARSASAADMIGELRRISAKVGRRVITRADLLAHAELMSERALLNRFGTWKGALEAAGLELSNMGRRWTEDDYFDNLLEVWVHHGRAPKYAEMGKPPSKISPGGYEARFGSWGRAKEAFVNRVNSDIALGEREAVNSVASPPIVASKPRQEDQRRIPVGLRYQVLRRDNFKCVLCGRSPATDPRVMLHVDHELAFSRGGKTRLDNLRSLCQDCNLGKRASD